MATAADRPRSGEAYLLSTHDRALWRGAHPGGEPIARDHALAHLAAIAYSHRLTNAHFAGTYNEFEYAHRYLPPGAHSHPTA